MRGISLLLFLVSSFAGISFAQEQQSGVIALKDGRMVAIQGDYQIFGEEVHFTDSNDRLMTLPLSKVDLKETDRRNKLIREGRSEELASDDPKKGPTIYIPPPKPAEPEEEKTEGKPLGEVFEKLQKAIEMSEEKGAGRGVAYEDWKEVNDLLSEGLGPWYGTFSTFAVIILVLVGFIHLFTRIWILYLAFQDSGTWFFTIIVLSIGGFGITIVYSPFVGSLVDLASMFAIIAFVLLHCHGRRLLLLALYTMPIWVGLLLGMTFASMAMFMG